MITLRKKIKTPDAMVVDSIAIKVVNKFRLLGAELQSNLNFDSFASRICLQANRKMFSIKRLFFLSNNVKLQFLQDNYSLIIVYPFAFTTQSTCLPSRV
jgi:hypothetical protein